MFPFGPFLTLRGGSGSEHPLLSRPRASHQSGAIGKLPGTIFSTRLRETEGYGGPPPELPLVLNHAERLCVRFFVP